MLTCLGQGSQTGPGAEIIFHPGHEAGTLPPDTRPRPPPAHHEPPTVPGNCGSMEIKVPGFQTFLIFQRDWGGGKVSDGSGGFWGHWSKSSASQTTHQQQGPGGPCSATCFRKETGRHRTSGGGGGEGRERAGCEERPGVRADAARLPTGRSAGGSQPREPGRWGARHMPGVHWSLGPPTLSPGPPLSLKSSLACSSRSPLPSWIQTVQPRATPPTRNKQPPRTFPTARRPQQWLFSLLLQEDDPMATEPLTVHAAGSAAPVSMCVTYMT